MQQVRRVHFIGIGGVGMSGIARVAHDQGMQVTGSDLKASRYTQQLTDAGIQVHIGHAAQNIPSPNPDVVVVSTAILEKNPELQEAYARELPIWHRAKMLAALGLNKKTLACAGTHGKTTSSSMLASCLDALGLDPSFLIGGIVRSYQTNAHFGKGEYYAVEADESDKSFTYLDPFGILVTNIEADHLDHYTDLAEIHAKFQEFMSSVHEDGALVICGDDQELVSVAKSCGRSFVTYGFAQDNDYRIQDFVQDGITTRWSLVLPNGTTIETFLPQNPGKHNALNATGVLALIHELGEDVFAAAQALQSFAGVRRRFDLVDQVKDITIVDDYAHHPTEIAATIRAAKQLGYKKVKVLFQPHRYSRVKLFTEVLKHDFSHAFDECDELFFMDVYPAGEAPVPGVSGKTFLQVILDNPAHPKAHYLPARASLIQDLRSYLEPGDLLFTMGAGDVTAIGPVLANDLKEN